MDEEETLSDPELLTEVINHFQIYLWPDELF